jgi:hypothetical protein
VARSAPGSLRDWQNVRSSERIRASQSRAPVPPRWHASEAARGARLRRLGGIPGRPRAELGLSYAIDTRFRFGRARSVIVDRALTDPKRRQSGKLKPSPAQARTAERRFPLCHLSELEALERDEG